MVWIRSAIARSSAGILPMLSRRSLRPSARSSAGLRPEAAFRSRAVAATAARSASEKTLSPRVLAFWLLGIEVLPWIDVWGSGGRHRGGLALEDPNRVAERVAKAHVGAVEVVDRLLGEVGDAALLEGFVQRPDIVGVEDEAAQRALRDELA